MAFIANISHQQVHSTECHKECNLNDAGSNCRFDLEYPFHASQSVGSSSRKSSADSRLSRASSISSIGITTPPWESKTSSSHDAIVYDYDLPCEFASLGCEIRFHPEQFEEWIAHSVGHFKGYSLPSYVVCTFCEGKESSFRNDWDKELNWRERMIHIGGHFAKHVSSDFRPDFWVLEHLKTLDLIPDDDYAYGLKHSLKPQPHRQANTPREVYLLHKEAREQGPWIEYNTRAESKSQRGLQHHLQGRPAASDRKARLRARLGDMSLEDLLHLRNQRQLRKKKHNMSQDGQCQPQEELSRHAVVVTDQWSSMLDPESCQPLNRSQQKPTTASLRAQYLSGFSATQEHPGKEHCLTTGQSNSVVDNSTSHSDTDSTLSEESLDWNNDRIEIIYPRYTEPKVVGQQFPSKFQISSEKNPAIDCLMNDFWSILDIRWLQTVQTPGNPSSPSQQHLPKTQSGSRT